MFVVTLLRECQQMSTSQSDYPIPYGSRECRKMLYNLLQTLLYYHHPKSPPPLQHAIIIFSRGTQDNDIEVNSVFFFTYQLNFTLFFRAIRRNMNN